MIGIPLAGVLLTRSNEAGLPVRAEAAQGLSPEATERWSASGPEGTTVLDAFQQGSGYVVSYWVDDSAQPESDEIPAPTQTVIAYDADGTELWRQEEIDEVESNSSAEVHAVPVDDDLVAVYDGERLRMIETGDGSERWGITTEVSQIEVYDDTLLVGRSDPDSGIDEENSDEDSLSGEVSAIAIEDGEILGSVRGEAIAMGPAGAVSEESDEFTLLAPDGNRRWSTELGGRVRDFSYNGGDDGAVGEDLVLLNVREDGYGSIERVLAALDATTGDLVWEETGSWDPVGTGPDGTVAAIESIDDPDDEDTVEQLGTLTLFDQDGPTGSVDLGTIDESDLKDTDSDPWNGPHSYDSVFWPVPDVGAVFLDRLSATTVSPDLELRTFGRPVDALCADGLYQADGTSLTLTSWRGRKLAEIEVGDVDPILFSVNGGVLTARHGSNTVRLYR